MNILLLADSHGNPGIIREILSRELHCNAVLFAGDGVRDIRSVKDEFGVQSRIVTGNTDRIACIEGDERINDRISGIDILIIHGDQYNVKNGLDSLSRYASGKGVHAVVYGHTHIQKHEIIDGVHYINPGAAKDRQYAVLRVDAALKVELKSI
jgi:uncharacterized protein